MGSLHNFVTADRTWWTVNVGWLIARVIWYFCEYHSFYTLIKLLADKKKARESKKFSHKIHHRYDVSFAQNIQTCLLEIIDIFPSEQIALEIKETKTLWNVNEKFRTVNRVSDEKNFVIFKRNVINELSPFNFAKTSTSCVDDRQTL